LFYAGLNLTKYGIGKDVKELFCVLLAVSLIIGIADCVLKNYFKEQPQCCRCNRPVINITCSVCRSGSNSGTGIGARVSRGTGIPRRPPRSTIPMVQLPATPLVNTNDPFELPRFSVGTASSLVSSNINVTEAVDSPGVFEGQ